MTDGEIFLTAALVVYGLPYLGVWCVLKAIELA